MSRIVITGAGGMLGRILTRQARRQGYETMALSSSQCDITDYKAIRAHVGPEEVVINCAAYTNVDGAETDSDRAFAVNAGGAANLARVCAETGAQLVHVSTDYVFSGRRRNPYETDEPTGPVNVYGRSKLAGEHDVLVALPRAVVVRSAWVYTGTPNSTDFVSIMRRKANSGSKVLAVDDQIGSPTYAADLADALLKVAAGATEPGVVLHAVNAGAVSRFEQARAVFEILGADPELVQPVPAANYSRPAPRPAFSALSTQRSEVAGLAPLRPWRDALVEALRAS